MEKNMISNKEQLERIKIRIVKLRDILGLKSAALAKKCGIDTSTMYRIEGRSRREYSVSERNLRKIAEAVDVDLNWLLGLSGEDDIPVFLQGEGDIGRTERDPAESQTACADRLRQLRAKLGLSQQKFADQVGVSLSMLSAIEQGRIKLSVDFARRISQKCDGITAEWLLYGEEYPVNDDLIQWLKNNREERVRLWKKIYKERMRK